MNIKPVNTVIASVMTVVLGYNVVVLLGFEESLLFLLQNVFIASWVTVEWYDIVTGMRKLNPIARCKWKLAGSVSMLFAMACLVLDSVNREDAFCIVCGAICCWFAIKMIRADRMLLRVVCRLEAIKQRNRNQQQREEDDHGVQK